MARMTAATEFDVLISLVFIYLLFSLLSECVDGSLVNRMVTDLFIILYFGFLDVCVALRLSTREMGLPCRVQIQPASFRTNDLGSP